MTTIQQINNQQLPQELQIIMKNSGEQIKNVNEQIKNNDEQIKNSGEQIKKTMNILDNYRFEVNSSSAKDPKGHTSFLAEPFNWYKNTTQPLLVAKQIFNHFIQRQHDSECVNIYRQLPQELQKEIDILTSEQSIKNQIMMKEMDEQSRQNQIMMKEMDEQSRQNQIMMKEMDEQIKNTDEQIKNMDDMLKGMDEMSRQNQILIKEMAEQHIQHEKINEVILQEIEMYKELNRQLDVAPRY
jgi:hypothetical protein